MDDFIDMLLEDSYYLKSILFTGRAEPTFTAAEREQFGEYATLYQSVRTKGYEAFHGYTRMSVEVFDYILNKIYYRIATPNSNICPEEKLFLTLSYLASGIQFSRLAYQYRMGKSTVSKIIIETCLAIWTELVNIHMPQPTEEDHKKIAYDYFMLWGFPNCIGSIDGKHCKIKCPSNTGSSFYNYKEYFSVILQAVADANKRFISVEIGGRGRQSDGGTFHYSVINKLIESGRYNIPPDANIPGTSFCLPYVLIGDEAYPLKTHLLRPFPSRNLNNQKEYFNKRLSRARKCVECAFGIITAKWRILNKPIETNYQHSCIILKAICVLHNIIRDVDGDIDKEYNNTIDIRSTSNRYHRRNNAASSNAINIRNTFMAYFNENRL